MVTRNVSGIRNQRFVRSIVLRCFLAFFLATLNATAQCAMCRASLESTGNQTKVEAVNDGIVFLMAIPYILAAVIGYVIYKMYTKTKKA